MNKFHIIALICLTISLAGLFNSAQDLESEKGDCYDNRDNKIDGLTCDVTTYENPLFLGVSLSFLLGALCLFFVGIIVEFKNE